VSQPRAPRHLIAEFPIHAPQLDEKIKNRQEFISPTVFILPVPL